MTKWLRKLHEKRCERKQALSADKADELAEKASRQTGALIISYKCYDCGKWHIGHADETQIAVRQKRRRPGWPRCAICNQRIPEARLMKAQRRGIPTRTCSKKCAKALQNGQTDPGSEGLPQPPS